MATKSEPRPRCSTWLPNREFPSSVRLPTVPRSVPALEALSDFVVVSSGGGGGRGSCLARLRQSALQCPKRYSMSAPAGFPAAAHSGEEICDFLGSKAVSAHHGLKHLFRSQDPSGKGTVSREAFRKILFTLCGYISPNQFKALLKRMGAESMQAITFNAFATSFLGTAESSPREWLKPAAILSSTGGATADNRTDAPVSRMELPPLDESNRKKGDQEYVSASYMLAVLKKAIREKRLEAMNAVANEFSNDQLLIEPHLREFLEQTFMCPINEKELHKLWKRFDTSGIGAVTANRFYSVIGLNDSILCSQESMKLPNSKLEADSRIQCSEKNATEKPSIQASAATEHDSLPTVAEDVIEVLMNYVDSRFHSALRSFRRLDTYGTWVIALPTFLKKLEELLGCIIIASSELEQLVVRASALEPNESVDYTKFLEYMHAKRRRLLPDLNNDQDESYRYRSGSEAAGRLSDVEAVLLSAFHKSFIKLGNSLREADKAKCWLLPSHTTRSCVEQVLGMPLHDKQWADLKKKLSTAKEDVLNYGLLLNILTTSNGSWAAREERYLKPELLRGSTGLVAPAVVAERTAAPHTRPRVEARSMPSQLFMERPPRPMTELSQVIKNMVNTQFYALDQAYRREDRKYTGRLDIEMLHRILKTCQEELTWPEMTSLWSSFDRAPDGMYTWSRFCHKYMEKDGKAQQQQRKPTDAEQQRDISVQNKVKSGESEQKDATSSTRPISALLDKLSPAVRKSMERITRALEGADVAKSGLVLEADARRILADFHLPITSSEFGELLQRFGSTSAGSFSYKDFLEACARREPLRTETEKVKVGSSPVNRMSAALRSSLAARLAGQRKLFKRACKAVDRQGKCALTIAELRSAMERLNLTLTDEEAFVLFNEHDKMLTGRIDYKVLLTSLLGDPK